jgi:hypothetical protein
MNIPGGRIYKVMVKYMDKGESGEENRDAAGDI